MKSSRWSIPEIKAALFFTLKRQIMENPDHKKAYELLQYLYSVHFNNEIFVEHLHEMYVAFSLDGEAMDKEALTNSYLNLRQFLRESQQLMQRQEKTAAQASVTD